MAELNAMEVAKLCGLHWRDVNRHIHTLLQQWDVPIERHSTLVKGLYVNRPDKVTVLYTVTPAMYAQLKINLGVGYE